MYKRIVFDERLYLIPYCYCRGIKNNITPENYEGSVIETWKIKNNKLYVQELDIDGLNIQTFAWWCSGAIKIPKGNMIYDEHDMIYEQEVFVIVENGIVTKIQTVNNQMIIVMEYLIIFLMLLIMANLIFLFSLSLL